MRGRQAIRSGGPAVPTDVEPRTPDALLAARVFTILWAIAHLTHLLRKPDPDEPVVWIVVGAALLLLDRPTSRWRLALLCAAQLLYIANDIPAIDNHVVIMGFVDLGLLISVLYSFGRNRDGVDSHPPSSALP